MSFRKGKIVYLSDVERKRLKWLAAQEGVSENEYIRLLIDRADRQIIELPRRKVKKEVECV